MAATTPIGLNALTSLTRRHIIPQIHDAVYRSNVLFYRLERANKRTIQGGTQIEVPIMYKRLTAAGNFTGFDLLDTTPSDTVKNASWGWCSKYVIISVDGTTIRKNSSAESVASILSYQGKQSRMEMEDRLGNGVYSDAVTDPKEIDGLQGAVDNGTVAATYGGLGSRTTTNDFWQPQTGGLDTTTTTLTLGAMRAVFGAVTEGNHHPTILVGTQSNYDRFWALTQVQQRFPTGSSGRDEQLAEAGFTNLLFDGVPFCVDRKVNTVRAGTTGDHLYFLNEEEIELIVHPEADMLMEDFQKPINQDVASAKLLWQGQLICTAPRLQGLLTAITA